MYKLKSLIKKEIVEQYQSAHYSLNEDQEIPSVDMSLDDFIKSQPLTEIETDSAKDIIRKKASGEKFSMAGDDPIVHRSNIVDENGKRLNPKELKRKFSERPKEILNRNAKIAKSGGKDTAFYNLTLPAYMGLYHDEKTGELEVTKICTSAGTCKLYCYARKGGFIQYPGSSLKATKIITFIKNDLPGFKAQLLKEIEERVRYDNKRGMQTALRWHDSGDFLDQAYLKMAMDVAEHTPEVTHYAYTKRVKMVSGAKLPDNFVIAYSFGGIEDPSIDIKKQRHAQVVPSNLFRDLTYKEKGVIHFNNENAEEEFKKRLSQHYKIPLKSIITYAELMKIPYDKSKMSKPKFLLWGTPKPKYNVIVKGGDGDDAAMRKDVLGMYILVH